MSVNVAASGHEGRSRTAEAAASKIVAAVNCSRQIGQGRLSTASALDALSQQITANIVKQASKQASKQQASKQASNKQASKQAAC